MDRIHPDELYNIICRIREKRPLIHCISNIVTVNLCANGLLAIGAAPVMAHHPMEVEEITQGADALVCNMGAMEDLEAMGKAAKRATALKHPIVIDPVGVAASGFRREQCYELIREANPSCIRGNVSEMIAIIENRSVAKGVDATGGKTDDLVEKMKQYAKRHGTILIASGKEDIVTDGEESYSVANGDSLMAAITGSGCLSSVILGAVLAVDKGASGAKSAALGCALIGIAGQKAAGLTRKLEAGTMTFERYFIDQLSLLDRADCEAICVSRLP